MARRVMILGGTAEARELAAVLAARPGLAVTLSLAGRTAQPAPQPVPVRIGGFGGVDGLAKALADARVDLLVDATHPFAARISANAVAAATRAAVPRLVLLRPEWRAGPGDRWHEVADVAAAVDALGEPPRRPFAALGRQEVAPLASAPQHAWLVRSIEPIVPPLALPDVTAVQDRGPFTLAGELALFRRHRVDAVLCKNSGGPTAAKLAAARALGIEVMIVARPPAPDGPTVASVAAAEAAVARWQAGAPLVEDAALVGGAPLVADAPHAPPAGARTPRGV